MARIRTVKPEFYRHRGLFLVERAHKMPIRLAYSGLFTCADRDGRFKWDVFQLKLDCLPYDDVNFSEVLDLLVKYGFLRKYSVNGKNYGLIPTFTDHQKIKSDEAKSRIPSPPEDQVWPEFTEPSELESNPLQSSRILSNPLESETIKQKKTNLCPGISVDIGVMLKPVMHPSESAPIRPNRSRGREGKGKGNTDDDNKGLKEDIEISNNKGKDEIYSSEKKTNSENYQNQKSLESENLDVDHYEGNWHLATDIESCKRYYFEHKYFDGTRANAMERLAKGMGLDALQLPPEDLVDKLRKWATIFNKFLSTQAENKRVMSGNFGWPMHFFNWLGTRDLKINPERYEQEFADKKSTKHGKQATTNSNNGNGLNGASSESAFAKIKHLHRGSRDQ